MVGVNKCLAITADVTIEHSSVVDRNISRQFGFLEVLTEMVAHEGVDFCWIEGNGCGVDFYAVERERTT